MNQPNQNALDLQRRYPRVADATGNGPAQGNAMPQGQPGSNMALPPLLGGGTGNTPTLPPIQSGPSGVPGGPGVNTTPAGPGLAATSGFQPLGSSFGSTQFDALSKEDPNFLLDYANRQQPNAQAANLPSSTLNGVLQPGNGRGTYTPPPPGNSVGSEVSGFLGSNWGGPQWTGGSGYLGQSPTQLSTDPNAPNTTPGQLNFPQLQQRIGYGYGQGYGV